MNLDMETNTDSELKQLDYFKSRLIQRELARNTPNLLEGILASNDFVFSNIPIFSLMYLLQNKLENCPEDWSEIELSLPRLKARLKDRNKLLELHQYYVRIFRDRMDVGGELKLLTEGSPSQLGLYARECIKGRWLEAEKIIFTDCKITFSYLDFLLNKGLVSNEESSFIIYSMLDRMSEVIIERLSSFKYYIRIDSITDYPIILNRLKKLQSKISISVSDGDMKTYIRNKLEESIEISNAVNGGSITIHNINYVSGLLHMAMPPIIENYIFSRKVSDTNQISYGVHTRGVEDIRVEEALLRFGESLMSLSYVQKIGKRVPSLEGMIFKDSDTRRDYNTFIKKLND